MYADNLKLRYSQSRKASLSTVNNQRTKEFPTYTAWSLSRDLDVL
jgi:hypothetical protein